VISGCEKVPVGEEVKNKSALLLLFWLLKAAGKKIIIAQNFRPPR
jgi:hypothetical protein